MLSETMKEAIEAEAHHFEQRSAAGIEALKIVQRENGWVDDESLREVASLLAMSPDELDGVATFYNLIHRRPVGKHVIRLCTSVSCWIMGCDPLMDKLCSVLGIQPGQTSSDGRFTLLPHQCLGCCDHGPSFMIGDDLYQDVALDQVESILQKYS